MFIWTGCDLQWLSEASGSIVETCFIFPFIVAKEQRFLDDQRAIYLTPRCFTSNLGQIKSNDRNLFVLCKIVIENFYQPCAIMERKKKKAQQFVPFSKLVECSLIKKASRRLSAPVIHLQHLQHLQFQSTIQLGSNAETLERENLKNYLDPRQARHSKD